MENNHKILLLSEDGKIRKIDYVANETPIMTSATEPWGEVKSSSNYIPYRAWRAFDGVAETQHSGWLSSGTRNQWISFTFPEKIYIDKYQIYSSGHNALPRNFRLEGSDDEINWETLDEQMEYTLDKWGSGRWNEFTIDNPKEYKTYRLYCVNNNGAANYISIPELKLSGIKKEVLVLDYKSEKDFINHGMSPQELSKIDFSNEFVKKHYIQSRSTPLGSGKVFEQPLDVDKIIKSVRIR